MDNETEHGLLCGLATFYLLGGARVTAETEYGDIGAVMMWVGLAFLLLALSGKGKPERR